MGQCHRGRAGKTLSGRRQIVLLAATWRGDRITSTSTNRNHSLSPHGHHCGLRSDRPSRWRRRRRRHPAAELSKHVAGTAGRGNYSPRLNEQTPVTRRKNSSASTVAATSLFICIFYYHPKSFALPNGKNQSLFYATRSTCIAPCCRRPVYCPRLPSR